MKYIFSIALFMTLAQPAQAETVYLVIKSMLSNGGTALHSIPMTSMDQCEEAGAQLVSSERFKVDRLSDDGFECIEGK